MSHTGYKIILGRLILLVNASEVPRTCHPLSVMGTKTHLIQDNWWFVTEEPLSLVSFVIPLVRQQPGTRGSSH